MDMNLSGLPHRQLPKKEYKETTTLKKMQSEKHMFESIKEMIIIGFPKIWQLKG